LDRALFDLALEGRDLVQIKIRVLVGGPDTNSRADQAVEEGPT
jgi:hypothetical protein